MVKALFRLNALQTRDTFDEFWCFLYCAIAVAWPSLVGIIMLTINVYIMHLPRWVHDVVFVFVGLDLFLIPLIDHIRNTGSTINLGHKLRHLNQYSFWFWVCVVILMPVFLFFVTLISWISHSESAIMYFVLVPFFLIGFCSACSWYFSITKSRMSAFREAL